jgi:pimeloyl-ACP methyl ester carboxylesterase
MPRININGVDLHYQCLGEGEPVVLIHGLAANLAFWYPGIASALAQNYQVIVFDLRGHGRSSIPTSGYSSAYLVADLHGLLSYLNINQAHLIGHSLGARVATCFTCTYPEQVASLTIADTLFQCLQPGVMKLKDWPYWWTWKQQMEKLGAKLPDDDTVMDFKMLLELDRIYTEISPSQTEKKPKLSLKSRTLGGKGRQRWQQLLETTTIVDEFDRGEQLSQAQLAAISVPTHTIYGEHSHCLPTSRELEKIVPHCQETIILGAGHFHPVIKPQEFVVASKRFLEEQRMRNDLTAVAG